MSKHARHFTFAGPATREPTVGQLVVERPSRTRVLEAFGLDYCCGGKKPLSQACREQDVDPAEVLAALEEEARQPAPAAPDWANRPLGELADHIQQTHHAYLSAALPRISFLAEKVVRAHGARHPELVEIRDVFERLRAELESHTQDEDRALFPICRQLGRGQFKHVGPAGPAVRARVQELTREHDDAGTALAELRQLAGDYVPPTDGCNTYRALFAALAELEADLHQHVHKENNILFPRAIAAAAAAAPLDWSI